MRAAMPSDEGILTEQAKTQLTEIALQLRDEQLAARIVHYRADLETSPELDLVTAQVIAELQMLQRVARSPSIPPPIDKAQLEMELTQSLRDMLGRLFRADRVASLIERKMAEVSKRFAVLFFQSELHDKIKGSMSELKKMRFPEQAIYHAFHRSEPNILRWLASFDYQTINVQELAKEKLATMMADLRNQYLSRTTPELNDLVKYLNEALAEFFTQVLPTSIGQLSREVVMEARLADAKTRAGYKISADAFPRFRQTFERKFLQLVARVVDDGMLSRVRARKDQFRVETIRFVADPHIFSDVCELVCDGIYDFLYNDGFLDLPPDWRARLGGAG
jgi:hypothetical protein